MKRPVTRGAYDTTGFYIVFYLATNTNGTLGGFRHYLFSVIYATVFFAVRFVATFESLP